MFEAAVIVIGVACVLAVVNLRQAGSPTAGADAAGLVAVGRALVAVRNETFLLGPSLIPGLNALLLGYVMYRSRLVPRIIPGMGLLGAPLLIASATAMVFGLHEVGSVWSGIATLPIALWELSLGIWLTFKGFSHPAVAALASGATVAPQRL